ncbi:MAG: ribulose bisphosphate carboxylase small subunit [Cyanobacteria bacterium J06597_16]
MPRLSLLANPQVHPAAEVHEFSFVEGDVQIGADALVAPGVAVTASSGASVVIGDSCALLPGVLIEGTGGAQVINGQQSCSVWVGDRTTIAHKSVVQSPAFISQDCFIGCRSTIFNARIGEGCIVMMHTLIQDVEVPAGKCVPSGSVITSQHQADQLPNVRPEDLEFAREITGSSSSSASKAPKNRPRNARPRNARGPSTPPKTASRSRLVAINSSSGRTSGLGASGQQPSNPLSNPKVYATEGANMQAQRLAPEIVQQVRQHLNQGYRIGMEHADTRRYRSGVWETCTPIKDTQEQAVFASLERCLAEHQGEYVRMFGIDTKAKRRMGMVTVQRPGNSAMKEGTSQSYGGSQGGGSRGRSQGGSQGALSAGIAQEVRNLLNAGYIIGTEHAGPRHYRSNVWKTCSPIESNNEREVFSRLEHCLDEHSGEYVRMFGINRKMKSRTTSTTIQRADGKPVEVSARNVPTVGGASQSSSSSYASNSYGSSSQNGSSASGESAQAVQQIISNGNKIGIEFADKRRYRSGIWQTAPSLNATSVSAAMSQLEGFLSQNSDKYVRIFGVNSNMKTRGASTTVQKPGQKQSNPANGSAQGVSGTGPDPINANPPHYDDPAFRNSSNSTGGSTGSNGGVASGVMDQVTQLVNQGCKISLEFADKRRFRSGIWKTGPAIQARRPAEAISELGKQLAQHQGDYVRLVGTDTQAKRRVVETTIQRPGQKGVSGTGPDPINANPPHYDDPAFRNQPSSYGSNGNRNGNNGGMASGVMDQVTQLVNQGHKISLEYADKRRYRSGIWKTGGAISARRPAEAISALGKQLAQHQGEYVRLVGTDTQAKRRVLEATIQRP